MSGNRYLDETAKVLQIEARLDLLETKTANLGSGSGDYKGYIYLNEYRQAGETDDNLALQRAKVAQLQTGLPIWVTPGMGSGITADDGIDKGTNAAIPARFRAQTGDYLIDSWSQTSNTSAGTTNNDPNNTTLPNGNDSGNMWSGMHLIGIRGQSRIRRANINKPFIFTCNPVNTPATTTNGEDEQSFVYKSMRLAGLTFVSNVQFEGYSEYQAQVQANAVDGLVIDNCESLGHRGDAFQIGNGHASGGKQNRHNRFVAIRNCLIDGANQNNRHPVTVTDGDFILLDNVTATQCGKNGRVNSASATQNDFNPNTGIGVLASLASFQQNILVTTSILRNVFVRNCSTTDGGSHAISLILNNNPVGAVNPTQDIVIEANIFKRVRSGIFSTGSVYSPNASFDGPEHRVRYANNTIANCRFPFDVAGINGIDVLGNTFTDCSANGLLGIDLQTARVKVSYNTFRRVGQLHYGAFIVVGCSGSISYNRFEDCVGADFSYKGLGITKDLVVDMNEVINTSATSPTMYVTMPAYDTFSGGQYLKADLRGESIHVTYHPSNNLPCYAFVAGNPSSPMVGNGTRQNNFLKSTSAWRNGSVVYNRYDAPRGEIEVLRKTGTFTGPTPADRWTPSFLPGSLPTPTAALGSFFVAPVVNLSSGAPAGVIVDDNNRLTSTRNTETFWKASSAINSSPWVTLRVAAPSLMTNGVMVGFTHATDYPENWIANNNSFGVIKFGVHFDSGNMRMIVGGALGSYVSTASVKTVIGSDLMFLNVTVLIMYNVNTGEGRVVIVHPDNKNEVTVGTSNGSATGQQIWPMVRFVNANEFVRFTL